MNIYDAHGNTIPISQPWSATAINDFETLLGLTEFTDDAAAEIVKNNLLAKLRGIVRFNQMTDAMFGFIEEVTYIDGDYSYTSVKQYSQEGGQTIENDDAKPYVFYPSASGTLHIGDFSYVVSENTPINIYYLEPHKENAWQIVNSNGVILDSGAIEFTGQVRAMSFGEEGTHNCRDIGGWNCDGGTVKYGNVFRGGATNFTDGAVLIAAGVDNEINLTGTSTKTVGTNTPCYGYTIPYSHYYDNITGDVTNAIACVKKVMELVTSGQGVYIHCALGVDRTGVINTILLGLLGVSESDLSKEYELSAFCVKSARFRNQGQYGPFISAIKSLGETGIRDNLVKWACTNGISIALINSFRAAMINGTPETLTYNA